MKLFQRMTALVLALVLVAGLLPPTARAEETRTIDLNLTRINPLYADVITEEDLVTYTPPAVSTYDLNDPAESVEEAAAQLRAQMTARAETATIHIFVDSLEDDVLVSTLEDIFAAALAHTGVPTEGDYLHWQYAGWGVEEASVYSTNVEGLYVLEAPYTVTYYTTYEQEVEMDEAVSSLLAQLDLSSKSDYQKIKGIYDYICANVDYDNANLENDDYTLKYTAYAALIDGVAVCQGYANLLYRLALELGVDARLIPGDGGGPHGWNIVELDDLYYNADSTWDANRTEYSYFLKCEANFTDHVRYEEWDTDAFHAAHPMASSDYVPGEEPCQHTYSITTDHAATCTAPGTRIYTCSQCGDSYTENPPATGHSYANGSCTVCGEPDPDYVEEGVVARGTCGESLTWVLDEEGTLTISGTGAMDDYVSDAYDEDDVLAPWSSYRWQISHIVLEEGVTSIGDYAFNGYSSLLSVTIPSTLSSIGIKAFQDDSNIEAVYITDLAAWCEIPFDVYAVNDCNNPLFFAGNLYLNGELVTDLVVPEGITQIQEGTFFNCSSIKTVTLPGSVTTIGSYAFSYCSLTSMDFSEGLTTIKSNAFTSADLPVIDLPEGLTTIEDMAFDHCGFESITIPSTITYLGEDVFYGLEDYEGIKEVHIRDLTAWCGIEFEAPTANPASFVAADLYLNGELLTDLVIPEGTASIESYAFLNCDSLVSAAIPATVTYAYDSSFKNCDGLKSVTFAGADTRVFSGAFEGCTALTDVVLPDNLTNIGDSLFRSCTSLVRLAVPAAVTQLQYDAFNGCSSLRELYIPAGVDHIYGDAFAGCTALTDVYFGGSEEQWTAIEVSDGNDALANAAIHYNASGLCDHTYVSGICSLCGARDPEVANDSVVASGTCGEGLVWVLNDEYTLTISGSGEMEDYTYNEATDSIVTPGWSTYRESVKKVVVEDGVTSISGLAFDSFTALTTVLVADSVRHIGSEAFSDCSVLTNVTLPETVDSLGSYLFAYCAKLTDVTLPGGITEIPEYIFSYCNALESVTLPDGITAIGDYAFHQCHSLTGLEIPATVTEIGQGAFFACQSLTGVVIPDGVTAIAADAFSGIGATRITIPDSVTTIGSCAFGGCENLKSVTLSKNLTSIDFQVFLGCSSLTSITIPASVKQIGMEAFSGCTALNKITFKGDAPEFLLSIGENEYAEESTAFEGVTATAYYPAGNATWTADVMQNYGGTLTWKIYCPDDHTYVDGVCTVCGEEDPNYDPTGGACGEDLTWHYDEATGTLTISGTGAMDDFTFEASPWYAYREDIASVILEEGITRIGDYAFEGCVNLPEVVIPEGVTEIGVYAFFDCFDLARVTFPDGLTRIEDCAFYTCESLNNVTLPDTLSSIGSEGFRGCISLTSITIPEGITAISSSAFGACTSLVSVQLPDSLKGIHEHAFNSCSSLTAIAIPEGVTSIGVGAFGYCESLTDVTIPDSVTTIGGGAFNGCTSLTGITIPKGVTTIENDSFARCSSLVNVTIPDSVTVIESFAFEDCTSLVNITLPDSVTSIGASVFAGCTALTGFVIPKGVEAISANTFRDCTALSSITVPAKVARINIGAFAGCASLQEIFFEGNAPEFVRPDADDELESFQEVIANAYYPAGDATWTADVMLDYGGDLTWIPYCPNGHTEVTDAAVAATCTATGLTEGSHCSVCGQILVAQQEIPMTDHTWDEGTVTLEPTENSTGIKTYTCTICGEKKEETIPALEHTHSYTDEVTAPTCTEQGYTTHTCACGETYVDTYVDALGHTEVVDEAVAADCTNTGLTEGKHCSVCNEILVAQTEVPALGHTEVTDAAVAATCTATGLTEGSHCSVCGQILVAQQEIPMTDHTWDEGAVTLEPTEDSTGVRTYICTVCGETREETIPAVEHTHQYTPVVTPPTCADQGYTTYTCTCGDSYVDDIVEAPGHTYVTQPAVAATCTESGLTEGRYCSVCGLVFAQQEVIPATGHSFQYGVCTVCGGEDPNYEPPAEPEEVARGTCGAGLTWVYETNNRLSIYGSGEMDDFVAGQTPWADYQAVIESVYTDKTVASIGMNAFLDCSRLTAWYFEGDRTEFSDLLSNVRSGNEPLKAADYYWAIRGACGDAQTFEYDHDTHTLTISGKGAMTDYNVNTTASVQTPWFDNMQTIQRIIVEEGVTSIGSFAFYDANDLILVSLPSTLTGIGDSAFGSCVSLESIRIPDAVTVIGPGAFESCNSLLSIVIPDGVTELLNNVFKSCNSMTGITLPDSITKFGGYTFAGCNVLSDFTMPANLEETGEYTFQGCNALTSVTFPKSFRSMGRYAFQESGLTTMTFEGDAPYFGAEPFGRVTATAYYPAHNSTWTSDVMQNYGGTLTWKPFCPAEHTWDEGTVTQAPTSSAPGVMTYTCTICGETKTGPITNLAARVFGADRYATAFAIADTMKEVMGIEQFQAVVISNSENFPDALAGSYLAAMADAPILLTKDKASRLNPVKEYISENLVAGGKVYILGSEGVVPASLENDLTNAGYDVERLAGTDRYETNLAVLRVAMELDPDKTKPILVSTGRAFADSLSVSASGLPLLLVRGDKTLTDNQEAFLAENADRARYVIGSNGVVYDSMYEAVGATKRIAGSDRYETSVAVANELVSNAGSVVLAYASDFPDGLCGGPLAYQMGASLILTKVRHEDVAAAYVAENGIPGGYVLGSNSLVTDDVVRAIFDIDADTAIGTK